jgi:hypothetical protein
MSNGSSSNQIADFTVTGFTGGEVQELQAVLPNVLALNIKFCVKASYNQQTQQLCIDVPVFGTKCIHIPLHIPVSASLKACGETCGSIIPRGIRISLYVDNNPTPIWSGVIWGSC